MIRTPSHNRLVNGSRNEYKPYDGTPMWCLAYLLLLLFRSAGAIAQHVLTCTSLFQLPETYRHAPITKTMTLITSETLVSDACLLPLSLDSNEGCTADNHTSL
ncbi:hypothetical protein EV421DRAFT_300801 [Armillaria borealis]|uniref:Uncharacterized protein n=1 Tax=Armillaria borealis TaxID=47425 RepID=A0AA39JNK9_9AGAR|nr:hypothetical protein EV421DRAFT_300801 [Armillaria borealis]